MTVTILKWLVIILASLNFGYMVFDGGRALTKGDYIRPTSGEYAGQLGPWNKLVESIGIDPESTLMKVIFVVWGLLGLVVTVGYALNLGWGWKGMIILNICSLWYLWMGTGSSIIQIILLTIIRLIK